MVRLSNYKLKKCAMFAYYLYIIQSLSNQNIFNHISSLKNFERIFSSSRESLMTSTSILSIIDSDSSLFLFSTLMNLYIES